MVQSKISYKVYFVLPFIIAFIIVTIWSLIDFEKTFTGVGGGIFVVTILIWFNLIFLFTAFKIQNVTLNDKHIIIKDFLGWGIDKEHNIAKTFGYYKASNQYKGNVNNYIYIVNGNKKLAKLCDEYHLNFAEMEHFLENNLTYLGTVHTNIFSDFKSVINNRDKIKI